MKILGPEFIIGRVRLTKCEPFECGNPTRMALAIGCSDIGPGGTPGLAAVPVCGECIEKSMWAIEKTYKKL